MTDNPTIPGDVYAFATEPDSDRTATDFDLITDTPGIFSDAVTEYGEVVGSDVTEHPDGSETVHQVQPSAFYTGRVPRNPLIGRTLTRTVNVFGNSQPIPLVNRNINRYRLIVWADPGNAQPVTIIGSDGNGVNMFAATQPRDFRGFDAFYCQATANGTLYVVEESYYVNEDGR